MSQALLEIIDLIESSSLQMIPNFLIALLESRDPRLWTEATGNAVENWALDLSQRIYVNEIKTVIQSIHGLHFNAHSTMADNVTNFSLEKMIDKFRCVTPKTWTLVQSLLDANGEAR